MKNLKELGLKKPKQRTGPLWEGPESDGQQGGVTQSLLGRFLSCRERFRIKVVEGLSSDEGFNPRLEYGNMWHVCEEALAGEDSTHWGYYLRRYSKGLCKQYPLDQSKIDHWYGLCKAFFPLYAKHWSEHSDVKERTPIFQEETFKVPYQLPSGRTVYLRGKWDAVDLIGKGKTAGIYLQENKTKSSIDVTKIMRQLKFDLQTMLYLVALNHSSQQLKLKNDELPWPPVGVRYNVIRRPAHKSVKSALKKFEEDQKEGRVGEWFARFKVEVSPADVAKFRRECLDPILEQLCDWYDWVKDGGDVFVIPENPENPKGVHFRFPFGVFNVTAEGGFSDVDAYLESGSLVGLKRVKNLFPEL